MCIEQQERNEDNNNNNKKKEVKNALNNVVFSLDSK